MRKCRTCVTDMNGAVFLCLKCGEPPSPGKCIESPVMEKFRILSNEEFYEVQEIIERNRLIFFEKMRENNAEKRATIRGSRLLTGLLYCECGKKCTSQLHKTRRQRADGTMWTWESASYRYGTYRTPKKVRCSMPPIRAESLEHKLAQAAFYSQQFVQIGSSMKITPTRI